MTVGPMWQCPDCPRQIPVDDYLDTAKNIHLKSHWTLPSGPSRKNGKGGGSGSNIIGDIAEGIGDFFSGLFGND